jgi:hypothetical protein
LAISLKSRSAVWPLAPDALSDRSRLWSHVIMDQCLFCAFDRTLHGLQLLRDLDAGSVLFEHFNDFFEVAIGTFQTPGNRGIRVVHEKSS